MHIQLFQIASKDLNVFTWFVWLLKHYIHIHIKSFGRRFYPTPLTSEENTHTCTLTHQWWQSYHARFWPNKASYVPAFSPFLSQPGPQCSFFLRHLPHTYCLYKFVSTLVFLSHTHSASHLSHTTERVKTHPLHSCEKSSVHYCLLYNC